MEKYQPDKAKAAQESANRIESAITFELMLDDNISEEANNRRDAWAVTREEEELVAVGLCGDSRILTPNPTKTSTYRTIAAGGYTELYAPIVRDQKVAAAIELVHYAGSTVIRGKIPGGCGGLHAKAQLGNGVTEEDKGIARFVKNQQKISHPDPIVHSSITAARISAHAGDKPVLAAAMDHETMDITPLALFTDSGRIVVAAFNLRHLFEGQYSPYEVYQGNQLPALSEEQLPDNLQRYLELHRIRANQLRQQIPDLPLRMRSQNPHVLDISNDNRPFSVAFPETSLPGNAFRLRLARTKTEQGEILLPEDAIEEVLQEAHYPIDHFDNLKTVLVRTGDMDDSRRIAEILLRQPYMEEWQQKVGNRVIFAKNQQGVITDYDELRLAA